MKLKKLTVNFPLFNPKELKTSLPENFSQYSNSNIPAEWLPIEGTEWKDYISVGDYGQNGNQGEINITPEHISSFYKNWKDKVIGRDICFNYNHEQNSPACLWVRDLQIIYENNIPVKLQYLPLYTPSGLKNIISQERRYLSIEYCENYRGKGPTLFGAGCTNDPFVVNEGLTTLENLENKKEDNMTLEELKAQLETLSDTVKELKTDNQKLKDEKITLEQQKEAEKQPENEVVKKLQNDLEALKLQNEAERKELKKSKLESFRLKWMSNGIPASILDKAEENMMNTDSKICLSSSTGKKELNLISIYDEVFSLFPTEKRVHLSQSGTSLKSENQTEIEKEKTCHNDAVEQLNKARQRGNK